MADSTYPALTKWPLLLVHGEPVTHEQANEILVRTDGWWLTSNDRDWVGQVAALVGLELHEHGFTRYDSVDRFRQSIRVLGLEYLGNRRIVSSWIGGPHGWCDWDGTIGCSTWNIGKWPTVEEVDEEWRTIAAAFPYLNLRAQLVNDEGEADYPAVEWRILKGEAHLVEPVGMLRSTSGLDLHRAVGSLFLPGRERGVSLERLREAVEQVRA